MGNTTHLNGKLSGSYHLAAAVHGKISGTWQPAKYVYQKISGSWRGIYSVLSASGNSSLTANGSGASTSGTSTTSGAGVSASGNIGTLSYLWGSVSGDGSISCSNSTIASPTFSRAFSGVSNGTTSSTVTGSWRCTVTDGDTGATTTFDVSLSFSWQNTIPAYGPFTASQSGFISSGASVTGAGHAITQPFTLSGTITKSGGPTSGSFSYSWSYISGAADISCSNAGIESPTFSGSITVPVQSTDTKSAIWKCHVVDLMSGYSADATVTVSYTYTNNTG